MSTEDIRLGGEKKRIDYSNAIEALLEVRDDIMRLANKPNSKLRIACYKRIAEIDHIINIMEAYENHGQAK